MAHGRARVQPVGDHPRVSSTGASSGTPFQPIGVASTSIFARGYPAEVYAFNVKVVRMLGRYFSYLLFAHDVSPPLDGDPSDAYPLRVELPPPPAHHDRRAIALRPFTGIPVLIRGTITYAIGHLYAIVGTLVILVTGELPASFAGPLRDAVAELTRMHAHVLLMTDEPLALPPSQAEPARAIGG